MVSKDMTRRVIKMAMVMPVAHREVAVGDGNLRMRMLEAMTKAALEDIHPADGGNGQRFIPIPIPTTIITITSEYLILFHILKLTLL